MKINFDVLANKISKAAGNKWSTFLAIAIIIVWAIAGPYFDYSDTWQLYINTFTTLASFIIGFLILNTQHRNDIAIHIKLDEIIYSIDKARNEVAGAEEKTEEEILKLKKNMEKDGGTVQCD